MHYEVGTGGGQLQKFKKKTKNRFRRCWRSLPQKTSHVDQGMCGTGNKLQPQVKKSIGIRFSKDKKRYLVVSGA